MTSSQADAVRLVRYGLDPAVPPARSDGYRELVGRYLADPRVAQDAAASALDLDVVACDPTIGLLVAPRQACWQPRSVTLWSEERLTHELPRCTPSTTPFAYEQVGDGPRLLVVENQATFASTRDLPRATAEELEVFGDARDDRVMRRVPVARPG
jgi:hypothetical protein